MSKLQLDFYYETNKKAKLWKVDVRGSGLTLSGIKLFVVNGRCTHIARPDLKATCEILKNRAVVERISRTICYRLPAYMHQNIVLMHDDNIIEPLSPNEVTRNRDVIRFHYAKNNSQALINTNVHTEERVEINGIILRKNAPCRYSILFPETDTLVRALTIINKPTVWESLSTWIKAQYNHEESQEPVIQGLESTADKRITASNDLGKDETSSVIENSQQMVSHVSDELSPNEISEPSGDCQTSSEQAGDVLTSNTIPSKEQKRTKNRFGRVANSLDSTLLKYTHGNVLRPFAMIDQMKTGGRYTPPRNSTKSCVDAVSSGFINGLDIEILRYIAMFRFITSVMLVDLYGSGYISSSEDITSLSQDKLNKHVDNLVKLGLITPCCFITVDDDGNLLFDDSRISIPRIHVLDSLGGLLLRELGRHATARPFDVYQDGRTVRERLCVNQWTVYWLASFPEVVSMRFGFNQVVYSLQDEMAGARLLAYVYIHDQFLIGQHVRRCDKRDQESLHEKMINKLNRLSKLFSNLDGIYTFDGDEYIPLSLKKQPIIQYICEDEEHMLETAQLLRPILPQNLEVWLTYDQRLFNYEYEAKRFWNIASSIDPTWLDPGVVFNIGEERKQEKALRA